MFLVAYRHLTFAVWVLVWDKAMEGVLINSFSFHVFCLKYFSLPAKYSQTPLRFKDDLKKGFVIKLKNRRENFMGASPLG